MFTFAFTVAWIFGDPLFFLCFGFSGLGIALLGSAFHHLTIEDQYSFLAIHFGPIPLLRGIVRYADIQSVEVGRTMFFEGCGMYGSLRGGRVWKLWGRDCVVVHLNNGVLRIGTDDAENLAGFLERKLREVVAIEVWAGDLGPWLD